MNSEYFISDVSALKKENIRWNITSSTITTGKTKFQIHRACPYVVNQAGKESPLIIETDKIFTYGVKESPKQERDGFDYSIPLAVSDLKQPTSHQENFIKACEKISEEGRNFLLKNKAVFNKDWIASDLRNVNILWYGKESKRPTLYAKLPMLRGKIDCDFIQPVLRKGQVIKKRVDPLLFRDVRCYVKAAVKIESIFIGSKISFQTKVHELFVFPPPKKVSLLTLTAEEMEGLEEDESNDDCQNETEDEEEKTFGSQTPPELQGEEPIPRRGRRILKKD